MEEEYRHPSLKEKLRSSICFSCCFRCGGDGSPRGESMQGLHERPSLIRSSSTWLRSRVPEMPELKEKYRHLKTRMGRSRRQSGDFRYDPLSYALNFDDGSDEFDPEDFRLRNFSARLPPSPPQSAVSREISVIS